MLLVCFLVALPILCWDRFTVDKAYGQNVLRDLA
jgi:hypothetical protein